MQCRMELAELTKSEPFSARTYEFETFLGIRVGNQLAVTAGERMKFDGYSEITRGLHAPVEPRSWLRSGGRLPYDRGARREAVPTRVFR